ncbi:sporulation protein YpjB [Niallia sp. 01092]|uniref:sporulation protein YpjB n=1 Tax=unclassified Niallia TaxID=2837522 RepID=UPI003FD1CC2B
MKAKFVVFVSVLVLLLPISISVYADTDQNAPIDELDTLSDEALQLVKSERYEDAKKILDYFSNQFSDITVKQNPFTMDELRIVTVAHDEAVEATTNTTMNVEERISAVTKFRLVVDAISSGQQPLWTQMKDPVMTTYNEMKEAAENGDKQVFEEKMNSFLSLYDIIYPSLKLDVATEQFQKLNALVQFIDTYRLQVFSNSDQQEELITLQSELQNVFNQVYEDETDPSLWWMIISTGSIIILTLSYVGWRKYAGDKAEKKRQRKSNHKI